MPCCLGRTWKGSTHGEEPELQEEVGWDSLFVDADEAEPVVAGGTVSTTCSVCEASLEDLCRVSTMFAVAVYYTASETHFAETAAEPGPTFMTASGDEVRGYWTSGFGTGPDGFKLLQVEIDGHDQLQVGYTDIFDVPEDEIREQMTQLAEHAVARLP